VDQVRRGASGGEGPGSFPLLTEGKRGTKSPSGPPAAVDTFGFSFDVDEVNYEGGQVFFSGYNSPDEVMTCRQALPGGGFVSTSDARRGNGYVRAWVEASMPKRVLDSNVEALGVDEALEAGREAFREATYFVRPVMGQHFENSGIVRLDGVRDFDGVASVNELLNGLAAAPRLSRLKVRRFQDPARSAAESLRVGPKAWNGQLYDKHAETNGEAEEGRLRSEFRMHLDQLTNERAKREGFMMRRVCDVTEEKVQRLTRSTFQLCAFDREVVGKASMSEKVFGCSWLSTKEQAGLWAYLTAPTFAKRFDRKTLRKYRRFAEQLGVTMAAADEEMPDVRVALDFDSGTEVVRVA